jgi:NADPH:quinone reductase
MRAFAVDEFGGSGSVRELGDPSPGEGQVRVRVEAASINPVDVIMLGGAYREHMEHRFPLVPGLDLAGTVDAVGPGVDRLRVGDPVFGVHGKMVVGEGTLAESVVATVGTLARRPAGIDAILAAALPLAGASALEVVDAAALGTGDVVLILGAAGGIGSLALQLAANAGARTIAVARSVNHEYVRALGAVETIDYESQDVFDTVRAAHPDGVAAIFDLIGDKAANARFAELVRPGGHIVSMLGGADIDALAARGITGTNVMTQVTTEKLDRLAGYVASGTLRRPEIRTFSLDDAGNALADIARRHGRGKLVVVPGVPAA